MIASTQLRPGMVVKFNNELHSVFSMVHRTPGNLRGFVQAKMRNLRTGSMMEHRFSSEDKVERVALDEHEMEYLYDDGEYYYFMNTENYEQTALSEDDLGDAGDCADRILQKRNLLGEFLLLTNHRHTTHQIGMSVQIFRRRMHNDIEPRFDRSLDPRSGKRVVGNRNDLLFACDFRDRFEID